VGEAVGAADREWTEDLDIRLLGDGKKVVAQAKVSQTGGFGERQATSPRVDKIHETRSATRRR